MEIAQVFAHYTSFVVLKYGHVSRDGLIQSQTTHHQLVCSYHRNHLRTFVSVRVCVISTNAV
jgi:hypothetical protein